MKRLYRNQNDRMIAGVCSGLADYLDMDVTIVRIVFILLALAGFSGGFFFFIFFVVNPKKACSSQEHKAKGNGELEK